jgi:interferon alpha
MKDRNEFGFPQKEFEGKQFQLSQTISILHEMTQQINLFSTKDSSDSWQNTFLHKLCTGPSQQLKELETYLTQQMVVEEHPLMHKHSILTVRKYFHKIILTCKRRNTALVPGRSQSEIMRSFSSSANLQKRLRSEE